jgi:4-azaleucine resistance transporter AzlC
MNKKIVREAFIASLPVMAGYLVLGTGFGVLLRLEGYNALYAMLMSITIYGGATQYVAVELIATNASLITTALTSLLVQVRHLFYGLSLIDLYKGAGIKKAYMIFGLTDETYSLTVRGTHFKGKGKFTYFFLVTLFNHCYWIIGGVIGALLGSILPFDARGMDFSLTALFVTIVIEQWKSNKDHFPAVMGGIVTLICLVIFGKETFLIPTMIVICVLLLARIFKNRKVKTND